MNLFGGKSKDLRIAGDAARDRRDYPTAEIKYRDYLAANPSDSEIWVQLGHAVKEQRGHKAAVEFYARAAKEAPNSVDAYTHLAHALKNAGDQDAATTAFEKAYALEPKKEFVRELRLLGVVSLEEARPSALFLSVQDLIGYLHAHQTLSGIQRVQAGIILHAIASENESVRFIRTDTEEKLSPGSYWEIDKDVLKTVIRYTMGKNVEHDKLRSLLDKCFSDVAPVTPHHGDTVLLLGAFWGYGNTANLYAPAKAAGAKIGAYIYDLIPYTHPEYCDADLAVDFVLSLYEVSYIADYFLTISEFTAIELRDFIKKNGIRDIPVESVPLAHTLSDSSKAISQWPKALIELQGARYVLYVSTIEGRKNHQYVVKIWQRLIAEGVDVPHLAFVGRMGWRVDGLKELLNSTDNLDGRIHIVHDLSDSELSALYDGAMFTTFTSFVEGWGLPVGEGLLHGKPCVASSTSSIPEVGGDFVDYVNPTDVGSGVPVFRRMIEDDAYRTERARRVKDDFKPRTWAEVTERLIDRSHSLGNEPRDFKAVSVPSGQIVKPGAAANGRVDFRSYKIVPLRILMSPYFYSPEHWGCWMKGRFGFLKFQTSLNKKRACIYLDLAPSPFIAEGKVTFFCGSQKLLSLSQDALRTNGLVRLIGHTDEDGSCSISIKVEGASNQPLGDSRTLAIGVKSFAYADVDDAAGRADILEAYTFQIGAEASI